jgi:hypothetical protein
VTQDGQVVCRRCGFANVPGDQFCGSCGAFLEWEGEPVAEHVPAPGPGVDPAAPVGTQGPATAEPVRTPGPVTAAPAPASAAAAPGVVDPPSAVGPDPGLVRCPACGIANQVTRTFCQSCGATLVQAPKVGQASSAVIAAAVAAPHKPAAPTTPRAQPGAPPASAEGGPRRFAGWIVAMAVLGVLVGVGVVVGSSLLKGEGPASLASEAPIASGGPGAPSTAPSGAAPTASAQGGEATSAAPAAKPVALVLTGATASSVVGDLAKFQPAKAIDGDPKTSWQEGEAVEKGQWIEVAFAPSTVSGVSIRNGYGASTALYKGNRRLKDVLVSVDGGKAVKARLKDTGKPQAIALAGPVGATSVRITIVSTYAGAKTSVAGTPFDDAAVSEISVTGVPGS